MTAVLEELEVTGLDEPVACQVKVGCPVHGSHNCPSLAHWSALMHCAPCDGDEAIALCHRHKAHVDRGGPSYCEACQTQLTVVAITPIGGA